MPLEAGKRKLDKGVLKKKKESTVIWWIVGIIVFNKGMCQTALFGLCFGLRQPVNPFNRGTGKLYANR